MGSSAVSTALSYRLRDLLLYFLKLGAVGFGGPVALVGYMHRDLVERRGWILEDEYREGLALAQLAPGPLAAQLAIYLGYVHYKVWGATLVGLAFVLPSFFMVLALGFANAAYGGLAWIQAVFYGIGAAVIGIIAVGSYRLSRKSLGKDIVLWGIFAVLAFTTILFEKEIIGLILWGGLVYLLYKTKPKCRGLPSTLLAPFLLQAAVAVGSDIGLARIAWFFLKAGAFVFGSGLAIVPFLYGGGGKGIRVAG